MAGNSIKTGDGGEATVSSASVFSDGAGQVSLRVGIGDGDGDGDGDGALPILCCSHAIGMLSASSSYSLLHAVPLL